MQRAILLIKPDGMPHRGMILQKIQAAGLNIANWREVRVTMEMLKGLYGHVTLGVFDNICQHMLGKSCLVIDVFGPNAINQVLEICGADSSPAKCSPSSLRYQFGSHQPDEEHLNVVHRARNPEEAALHAEVLRQKLELTETCP